MQVSFAKNAARSSSVMALVMLLVSCGGGGGGSSSASSPASAPAPQTFTDGLGSTGLAPASKDLSSNAVQGATPSIVLDNSGNGLALWAEPTSDASIHTLSFSYLPSGGSWGAEKALSVVPSVFDTDYLLKSASDGNAVLVWNVPTTGTTDGISDTLDLIHYQPTIGWDSAATNATPSDGSLDTDLTTPVQSDLGVFVGGAAAYTQAALVAGAEVKATYSQPVSGTRTITADAAWYQTYLGVNQNSSSVFVGAVAETTAGLYDIYAQLATGGALYTLATGVQLCTPALGFKHAIIAGTSEATAYNTVVLELQDTADTTGQCKMVDLEAIRFNASGTTVRTRLNAAAVFFRGPATLSVDNSGDALVTWGEATAATGGTYGAKYAAALWTGNWSIAANIVNNATTVGTAASAISVAMDGTGQAYGALLTQYSADVQYICGSRFTFGAGWSACTPLADVADMSTPNVAINSSGRAEIVFTGSPSSRNPTTLVPTGTVVNSLPVIHTYALAQ